MAKKRRFPPIDIILCIDLVFANQLFIMELLGVLEGLFVKCLFVSEICYIFVFIFHDFKYEETTNCSVCFGICDVLFEK